MAIGPAELLLIVGLLLILPVIALISLLTNQFKGNDKIVWVLVVIFIPVLGSILYLLIGRNQRIKNA